MRGVLAVLLTVLLSTDIVPAAAQSEGRVVPSTAGQALPGDELLALLPESDLIAMVDLPTILSDLLPRLDKAGVKALQPLALAVRSIATRAGVETRQLGWGAIGLSLQSFEATGILLVKGFDPDLKVVEDLLRQYKLEYKATQHDGVTILSLTAPPALPSIGPLTLNTAELAYASLGQGIVAIGDLSRVRKAIDRRKAVSVSGPTPALVSALREDLTPALLRFAFALTPGMREEALNQGDLFRSIATVRVVQGTLRVSPDLEVDLNTLMRTSAAGEAAELEQGLKGLLNLARVLLANGNQPLTDILNRVRIAVRSADVALSVSLPSTFIERLGRTP